jgi:signal transduction histidine kinase
LSLITRSGIRKRQTVLIVDDEPNLRVLVHSTIESPYYQVIEARDGEEAWTLIKERKPALVLLDINMPRRSGFEVLTAIRADPELRGTQVMILTSSDNQADIDRGILAGADFYLTSHSLPPIFSPVCRRRSGHECRPGRHARYETQLMELQRGAPRGVSASQEAGYLLPARNAVARSPRATATFFADSDQKVALGRALAARVPDATLMIAAAAAAAGLSELGSRRFAKPIRHVHNLASRGIARFLITGEGSTEKERNFIGRLGVLAALYGLSVATLARSYLLWRDTNLLVLNQEVSRLGIAPAIADEARAIIRSSADTGIVRMARAYDYQIHVFGKREDAVTVSLHDSEAQLRTALADISGKNDQLSAAMAEISTKNMELKGVNRQQSDFIANVSHELRTPLAGILGYTELLLEGADGELGSDQRRDMLEVQSGGQLLLSLVNDILDESQIEAGKMALNTGCVNLKAMVESVAATVRTLAEAKALFLHADIPDGAEALGDEGRLKQILTNLVGNAIKFTDAGGITINCLPWSGFWRVSVTDTGIGLPEESRDLVFERFRQLDPSITRRFGGTGLGLAIAKGLVTIQGGQMGVDSTLGDGSTFWFTIPAYFSAARDRPARV